MKTRVASPSPSPARLRVAVAALAGWAAACGGDREPPRQQPATLEVATRADPAGRTPVATVNGEPIYGDCVAAQAGARGIDREAALAQCIDFELMAQEARRRGLLADPDVLETRRTEIVRALVESEFAPTLDDPTDVPAADVHWLWDTQLSRRYNRPERRRATYCRAPFPQDAPAGSPEDVEARALAEKLHAALDAMRELEPARFAALCWMAAGGREVKTTPVVTRAFSRDGRHEAGAYAPAFAGAAFTVAKVGGVSRPTRTNWGWDVVLLTEILPVESRTFEEAEPEIREMLVRDKEAAGYRDRKFQSWIAPYLTRAQVEVHPENLPDDQTLARTAAPSEPGRGAAR